MKAEAKKTNIATMKDVIFLYSSVNRATEQKNEENKPALSDNPLEFHSFEIKILISEARFKTLKKEYKGAKNLPNAKELEADELCEKYSFLNRDDLEDDMVLIKFSQAALVGKKGARKPSFPIKQIGVRGKVQDNHGHSIDQSTSIGNGTKGHFQFRPVETKFGLYLYPHLLCITDLVEYVGGGGEEDLESLGLTELEETDVVEAGEVHSETNESTEVNDSTLDSEF